MKISNLKKLRIQNGLTQEAIAEKIGVKRSSYVNWENGTIIIPINILDKLSLFYNVSLSLILGISNQIQFKGTINPINYNILINNINTLKSNFNYSFEEIATYLDCNKSTCCRYFNNKVAIPTDKLVLLSKLFNIDIDKLCGKV